MISKIKKILLKRDIYLKNLSYSGHQSHLLDLIHKNDIKLSFFQSNIEGKLVDKIQASRNNQDGLIINAGGYTHTSVAIHDALKILKIPVIELHISNIYNREEFRHKSLISKVARGVICGFGAEGYIMSLNAMKKFLEK